MWERNPYTTVAFGFIPNNVALGFMGKNRTVPYTGIEDEKS